MISTLGPGECVVSRNLGQGEYHMAGLGRWLENRVLQMRLCN